MKDFIEKFQKHYGVLPAAAAQAPGRLEILGNHTGISSFWVLFSILLFGGMWGLVGMIVAVPLFAVIYDITRKLIFRGLRIHGKEQMLHDYHEVYQTDDERAAEVALQTAAEAAAADAQSKQ